MNENREINLKRSLSPHYLVSQIEQFHDYSKLAGDDNLMLMQS